MTSFYSQTFYLKLGSCWHDKSTEISFGRLLVQVSAAPTVNNITDFWNESGETYLISDGDGVCHVLL